MFPGSIIRYELHEDSVAPSYLDGRSTDLVEKILLTYQAFQGRPFRDLRGALEDLPDADGQDPRVLAGLREVIEEWMDLRAESAVPPPRLRRAVFELGRRNEELDAEEVFARAGREVALEAEQVRNSLYADIRDERRVCFRSLRTVGKENGVESPGSPILPDPGQVISRYNFRLLQGLLFRAERIRLRVPDRLRAVYRFAKLHGLLLEVKEDEGDGGDPLIEITGPLSLFRRTLKYGRALARFLPACCTGARFRLEADLVLGWKRAVLAASEADRILPPGGPPSLFDSRIEKRLHQDFLRLRSRWEIAREAHLLRAGGRLFLPDFTFRLRDDPPRRIHLEVIGFWTRDYLERKRLLLSRSAGDPLLLCVDEKLACDPLTSAPGCILFSGRVPAEKVLHALEARAKESGWG